MKAATTNLFFVPLLLLNSIMFVKSFTQIARQSSSMISKSTAASIQRTSAVSYTQQQLTSPLTTRYMSSPSEEQTSVVDTCREKIVKALETDDVKVLGTYLLCCAIYCNENVLMCLTFSVHISAVLMHAHQPRTNRGIR